MATATATATSTSTAGGDSYTATAAAAELLAERVEEHTVESCEVDGV